MSRRRLYCHVCDEMFAADDRLPWFYTDLGVPQYAHCTDEDRQLYEEVSPKVYTSKPDDMGYCKIYSQARGGKLPEFKLNGTSYAPESALLNHMGDMQTSGQEYISVPPSEVLEACQILQFIISNRVELPDGTYRLSRARNRERERRSIEAAELRKKGNDESYPWVRREKPKEDSKLWFPGKDETK